MTNRPLSPHLQVYRPQLTSVLSILHRLTGVVISLGIPFLVYWVWALGQGPDAYDESKAFFGSILGRTMLLGWTFAFWYHFCNGVRHLFWDIGMGLELPDAYRSGWVVVAATALLTLVTWSLGYTLRDVG